MYALRVLLVGFAGYLILISLARRLLHDPKTTARRFAALVLAGVTIVHIAIALVGAPWSAEMIVVTLLVAIPPLVIGYPVAVYLYNWYRRVIKHNSD